MSNKKEFQCSDSTKLELTLESNESSSDFLKEESKKLEKYIDELTSMNSKTSLFGMLVPLNLLSEETTYPGSS